MSESPACVILISRRCFVAAARFPLWWTSALIWTGAVILFVGEHWLRPRLFPDRSFAGLTEQLQDTIDVWRRAP